MAIKWPTMYRAGPPRATSRSRRRARFLGPAAPSYRFELGISGYKFFGSVIGEADRQAAIVVFAIDGDNRSDAVIGVADPLADQRIGLRDAAESAARRTAGVALLRNARVPRRCLLADAAGELLGGVGVFRVGLVAARLAGFGQLAGRGLNELAGYLRKKTRGG